MTKQEKNQVLDKTILDAAIIAARMSDILINPELIYKVIIALETAKLGNRDYLSSKSKLSAYASSYKRFRLKRAEQISGTVPEMKKHTEVEKSTTDKLFEIARLQSQVEEKTEAIKKLNIDDYPEGYVLTDEEAAQVIGKNTPKNLDHIVPEGEKPETKPKDDGGDFPF